MEKRFVYAEILERKSSEDPMEVEIVLGAKMIYTHEELSVWLDFAKRIGFNYMLSIPCNDYKGSLGLNAEKALNYLLEENQ